MKNLTRFAMINFLLIAVLAIFFFNTHSQNTTTQSKTSMIVPTSTPSPTVFIIQQPTTTLPASTKTPTNVPPTSTPGPTVSLISQVPSHNNQSDCWVVYNGGVYDITGFFGQHPGGDFIIAQFCGRDITTPFNTMDKIPPKSHSQKAHQLLESYRLQ